MSQPPTAISRAPVDRKRRISLIWAIPFVAMLIGAWLVYDTLSKRGPLITVTWASGQGLVAGQSHVKHKDVDMGVVQSVVLSDDLRYVTVTIRMNQNAEPMLTNNAQLWVVTPRFFAGNLSGLGTLLSGSYIELNMAALGGTPKRAFTGLEDPPLLQSDVSGTTFLLKANRVGSINVGSPIFYRDLAVGQVLGWDLGELAESVTIHAFVRAPFDKYVRDETRFWNASGVAVKLGAGGIQLQLESMKALLLGGVAFETPRALLVAGGAAAPAQTTFPLYDDQDAATRATYQRRIQAVSYFPGSVGGLAIGSAVKFQGLRIGEVTNIGLAYDPETDTIRAPVEYEIEPERIANIQVMSDRGPLENARMLVRRGMRAQVKGSNLLTGEMEISLDIIPDAKPAELKVQGKLLVVPAVEGGLSGITNAASEVLAKINRLPFDQMGKSLADTLNGASPDRQRPGNNPHPQIPPGHNGLRPGPGQTPGYRRRPGAAPPAGNRRRVAGDGDAGEQGARLRERRLWGRLALRAADQPPPAPGQRRRPLGPRPRRPSVPPPGSAHPRPHQHRSGVAVMRRRILLASLAALSGCASPNPDLYTIAVVPGPAQQGGPRLVVVREIAVARYLERSQIVRSSEAYRLDVKANDWWGEPLGSMLGRILVEELGQRMPGTTVFPELGAISADADAVVELNIQRMDIGPDGALLLAAQIAVSPLRGAKTPRTRTVRLAVPVASATGAPPDTRSVVAAISVAVGQLADAIAALVRG